VLVIECTSRLCQVTGEVAELERALALAPRGQRADWITRVQVLSTHNLGLKPSRVESWREAEKLGRGDDGNSSEARRNENRPRRGDDTDHLWNTRSFLPRAEDQEKFTIGFKTLDVATANSADRFDLELDIAAALHWGAVFEPSRASSCFHREWPRLILLATVTQIHNTVISPLHWAVKDGKLDMARVSRAGGSCGQTREICAYSCLTVTH
jgi:hypothetical protein